VTTVAVGVGVAVSVALGDSGGALGIIDAAMMAGAPGLMNLPSAPPSYINFCRSLYWTFLTVIPLGRAAPAPTPAPASVSASGVRRALSTTSSEQGIEAFAAALGVQVASLVLSTLLSVAIMLFVYGALLVFFWQRLFSLAWREATVKVLHYTMFPVVVMASFALSLGLGGSPASASLSAGDKALQITLGVLSLAAVVVWFALCLRYTSGLRAQAPAAPASIIDNSKRPESPQVHAASEAAGKGGADAGAFSVVVRDWRRECAAFWTVRASNLLIKGIFLGCVVRPAPIQGSVFLVCAAVYLVLLLALRPYRIVVVNKVAAVVAGLALLSCVPPIVFAFAPAPLNAEAMSAIGIAAVVLNILSVLGMVVVVALNWAMRHREAASKAAADSVSTNARDGADPSASASSSPASSCDIGSSDVGLSFIVDATKPGHDVPTASLSKQPEETHAQLAVPVDEVDSSAVTLT
jgi:hypothetical protein